jgi:UDP-N-acetylglucosamine 2-epimerase (non-hydrolysing)
VDPDPKTSILVAVGTRPEAIKLVPLILALRESERLQPLVVSTGQHHALVEQVFGLADITPDVTLWVGGTGSIRLNELVAAVLRRFEDWCVAQFGDQGTTVALPEDLRDGYPAAVLVHGDTSSSMATALAAFHLRIPVIHVEAGLRTGGFNLSPFPEEMNRQVISRIASFHLAPTITNAQNLIREGVPHGTIFVTGNTGIDALHWAAGLDAPFDDPQVEALASADRPLVVVAEGVRRIVDARPDVSVIVPLHPNPLVRRELGEVLDGLPTVLLTEPLSYVSFARLLRRATLVLTDSGGIQEEAPSFDTPVLVCRDRTERTEGVEAGTLLLVGTDPDRIAGEALRLLGDEEAHAAVAAAENPYGDGRAAARIVEAIVHLGRNGPAPEPFGPGYDRELVLAAAGYAQALDPQLLASGSRGVPEPRPAEEALSWHRR